MLQRDKLIDAEIIFPKEGQVVTIVKVIFSQIDKRFSQKGLICGPIKYIDNFPYCICDGRYCLCVCYASEL